MSKSVKFSRSNNILSVQPVARPKATLFACAILVVFAVLTMFEHLTRVERWDCHFACSRCCAFNLNVLCPTNICPKGKSVSVRGRGGLIDSIQSKIGLKNSLHSVLIPLCNSLAAQIHKKIDVFQLQSISEFKQYFCPPSPPNYADLEGRKIDMFICYRHTVPKNISFYQRHLRITIQAA